MKDKVFTSREKAFEFVNSLEPWEYCYTEHEEDGNGVEIWRVYYNV